MKKAMLLKKRKRLEFSIDTGKGEEDFTFVEPTSEHRERILTSAPSTIIQNEKDILIECIENEDNKKVVELIDYIHKNHDIDVFYGDLIIVLNEDTKKK